MDITQKEEALLYDLVDYKFLNFQQIKRMYYPNESANKVRKILYNLMKDEYIVAHRYIHTDLLSGVPLKKVYYLSERGTEEMSESLEFPTLKNYERPNTQTLHTLHIVDVVDLFRASSGSRCGKYMYEYVDFISEYKSFVQYGNHESEVIRPDGTIVLKITNQETGEIRSVGLFLEYERTIKKRGQYNSRKIVRYNAYSDHVYGRLTNTAVGFSDAYAGNPLNMAVVVFIAYSDDIYNRIVRDTKSAVNSQKIAVTYKTIAELKNAVYDEMWRNVIGQNCNVQGGISE